MSHTTKSTVQCHLDSKKHQVAVETMQKREKARVERRLEAEADALPHKAAMRQPSLQSVVASCNDKNKAADDTVFAFAGAGIPLDKLDHPLVRAWLQKYTTIAGCLPQGSSDFPKVNGQRVLDGHRGAIHKKTADRNTTLLFDEWTDERGVPVLAIIAHVGGRLKLQHVWRNARWFLCWSHKLAGIGDILRKHDVFSMINLLYRSSSLVKVPMHSARRRRWRERSGLETVPPNIGDTRWTSWRDGADWYCENWEAWKDFVVLDAGKTKRNEENLSLMHEIHDCITKQGVNCVVRLAFITDHTSVLMAAINLAQSDGPVAVGSGQWAVERFFSQAGNVSKKQNKLLNPMRRLAFMARFNLDVEGRLV